MQSQAAHESWHVYIVYHPQKIRGCRADPPLTSASASCGFADPTYPTASASCGFADPTHPTASANCGADDTTSADLADAAAV
jgi:hypothetical protein